MKILCSALMLVIASTGFSVVIPLTRGIYSIAIGDVDQNGLKDIVVGHVFYDTNTAPSFTVLYNYSNGAFASADSSFVFGAIQDCIQLENMNADNFPDIICKYSINNNQNQFARVYYNQNGSFDTYTDYPFTGDCHYNEIRTGDVNGDGYGDIIFYSWAYDYLWVLISNKPNQFLPLYQCPLDFPPQDICVGDVDNDGDDEIVFAGQPLTIFDYTASGWQQIALNNMTFHNHVKLGDADNDGVNEIFTLEVFAGFVFPVRIYKLVNGQIELMYQYLNEYLGIIQVLDYNNDNLADFQIGNCLFTNLGNYSFNESELNRNSFPNIEDMNNDGFQDMVIIGGENGYGYLIILFGDGLGHFTEEPVAATDEHLPPPEISILKNYPNPFTSSTRFTISPDAKLQAGELFIYNLKGQLIRKLFNMTSAGEIIWDGLTNEAMSTAPGIYLCRYADRSGSVYTTKILKSK
ncbi:MAG: FG-GAP-like repeat-containing protein [Candidatus Cloacimonas sp.]|nr:FG-GAP-like repeat-containing protein [Candidatus Cloacimonas sp.]